MCVCMVLANRLAQRQQMRKRERHGLHGWRLHGGNMRQRLCKSTSSCRVRRRVTPQW